MDVNDLADRPRPILEAIRGGGWKTLAGTLIAAAVSFGILNAEQATALDNVVAAVVTLITFVTSAVAQFHVLDHAEPQVTPVADPRDDRGRPLVPAADEPGGQPTA
ncbi:hypothetical protein [Amycolatopsis sp. CFH S0078]|uniref:hypothetical protein n=1 Tax=Amycolatopsis sp. CFH S0078 TaxID=1644108 RepID=UPI00106E8E37|nr:hypothetical protein [Amycolatopsis sp. CFH S0078]